MKVTSSFLNIGEEFNLGLMLSPGIARNDMTGEELDVTIVTVGLMFLEIYIIW